MLVNAAVQTGYSIEKRLDSLIVGGVVVVDPRQTWVAPEVDLERIHRGAVLHPGTRLGGSRCFVGERAVVGAEGPATLVDTVLDDDTRLESGYAESAVLLSGAVVGSNAHLRQGTLLEEHAKTGHAVGLKQAVLLSFVTLGSLINFCDSLMAGGTGPTDHSEVGSGFIHFNFTRAGDKATPSLIGDVPRGVFLREPRIFLGGAGGLVGPLRVGYGSVTGAGQVVREDVPDGQIVLSPPPALRGQPRPPSPQGIASKVEHNVEYVANLVALRAWYREVRLPRSVGRRQPVIQAAIDVLDVCIAERIERLRAFLRPHPRITIASDAGGVVSRLPGCPLNVSADGTDHVSWVRRLEEGEVQRGREWLMAIVDEAKRRIPGT